MASNFAGYGEESAKGEHNVACDPVAMEEVLRCGLPLWIIGLNVTCQTSMTRARMEALAAIGGPLAEGVCGMHRVWLDFVRRDSSPMHDGLAVATAFRPDLVELAPATSPGLRPPIERGAVMYESAGPNAPTRITADLHADAFHALLFERVTAAVENAKRQMQSA
jgi:purine nucleosidase